MILTVLMLVAAGIAIVVQNLIMVRVSAGVSTLLIALALNSIVGLVLLTALIWARGGGAALLELAQTARGWALLPGLLGTFFVFAALWGYRSVGAAATVALLVASQLVAGLVADSLKGDVQGSLWVSALGVAFLIVGAILILQRSL